MLRVTLFIMFLIIVNTLYSQHTDSTQTTRFFRGQITATNNGISLIPNFSLNKPAAMFDLSIGKGRLSFDPMIRFSLNGKPWAFVFWWRYKLIQQQKFNLGIGAHPSVVFRDITVTDNGITRNYLSAQRYFAWEVSPVFTINKKLNAGLYYLGSKGLTKDLTQNTTFIALRSNINIPLNKFAASFTPQLYYLKMDDKDGMYTNLTFNFYKKKLPISFNAVISKSLKTEIPGKSFLWSVGFVYNINNTYIKKNNH
jgi:hypothetical protein